MPITIDPTPISIPQPPITIPANRLHIDSLTIDASGEVLSPANRPTATIRTRAYAEDANGVRTYGEDQDVILTRDFYSACTNVPQMAAAMQAVFNAVAAWRAYAAARKAVADAAQADLVAKQAAFLAAQQSDASNSTDQTVAAVAEALAALNAAGDRVAAALRAYDDPANPPVL